MSYTRFYPNDYTALVYKFPSDYYHALNDAYNSKGDVDIVINDGKKTMDGRLARLEVLLNEYYSFDFYNVIVSREEYGGFSLHVSPSLPDCFSNKDEKKDVRNEIKKMRDFLQDCIAFIGMRALDPLTATGLKRKVESYDEIEEVIQSMRADLKKIPISDQE